MGLRVALIGARQYGLHGLQEEKGGWGCSFDNKLENEGVAYRSQNSELSFRQSHATDLPWDLTCAEDHLVVFDW